jgi:hypothetical protein
MDERAVVDALVAVFNAAAYGDDLNDADMDAFENGRAVSFEREGVMTNNAGVVLKTADGSEFQITVVQSK